MAQLLPCTECQRHVRAGAPCPFCGAESPAPIIATAKSRAPGRFAMLFAGTIGLGACGEGGEVEPESTFESESESESESAPESGTETVSESESESETETETETESESESERARRESARAEEADGAKEAAEEEEPSAVAAYGGPALRPEPLEPPGQMVPLYGGPSTRIDE